MPSSLTVPSVPRRQIATESSFLTVNAAHPERRQHSSECGVKTRLTDLSAQESKSRKTHFAFRSRFSAGDADDF